MLFTVRTALEKGSHPRIMIPLMSSNVWQYLHITTLVLTWLSQSPTGMSRVADKTTSAQHADLGSEEEHRLLSCEVDFSQASVAYLKRSDVYDDRGACCIPRLASPAAVQYMLTSSEYVFESTVD
jgi:hypothetical protein